MPKYTEKWTHLIRWKISDNRSSKRADKSKAQTKLVQPAETKIRRFKALGQHLELKVTNKHTHSQKERGEIEELREQICFWNPCTCIADGGNEWIDVIQRDGDSVT